MPSTPSIGFEVCNPGVVIKPFSLRRGLSEREPIGLLVTCGYQLDPMNPLVDTYSTVVRCDFPPLDSIVAAEAGNVLHKRLVVSWLGHKNVA